MAEFIDVPSFADWEDWVSGGVDWLAVLSQRYEEHGEELKPIGFRIDGQVIPVNQNNTRIFISAANDDMDCIMITDPSDEETWTWYREECPFDTIVGTIGHLATMVSSPRPMDFIIQHYEAREDEKLEEELKHLGE